MTPNNTYENINSLNNILNNQYNISMNDVNNINLQENEELTNKEKFNKQNWNQNFVSNAIIENTNNIPNFQNSMDNIPSNKFNNSVNFYGYRSYQ